MSDDVEVKVTPDDAPELTEDEFRRAFFDHLVQQESDTFEAAGAWPHDHAERADMIMEIQDLFTTFFLARLQRYSNNTGIPGVVKFQLNVQVDGNPTMSNELTDLLVPEQKLIVPG